VVNWPVWPAFPTQPPEGGLFIFGGFDMKWWEIVIGLVIMGAFFEIGVLLAIELIAKPFSRWVQNRITKNELERWRLILENMPTEEFAERMRKIDNENAASEDRDTMLALDEMRVIEALTREGPIQVDEAIEIFSLADAKYFELAKKEGLDWMAGKIQESMQKQLLNKSLRGIKREQP
jgi:hypothetical protein